MIDINDQLDSKEKVNNGQNYSKYNIYTLE